MSSRIHHYSGKTRAPWSERQCSPVKSKSKKGHNSINIKVKIMALAIHVHIHVYQVSFEYLEWFVSYGPRLKFLHDDEDDDADNDAKAMTITRLFFSKKTDELKTNI